ncbi:hypothetical protein BKA16_003397 [Gordonia humi]|uniref:DUF2567 domain-containing protein n=1 Tax=Gordonia humi TaxID=686429 RepID=A0A840EV76_9ACTN|nr:hypothetical protein [Gordonia humi]
MTAAAPAPTTVSARKKPDIRTAIVFIVVVLALSVLVGGLWVWLSPPVDVTVDKPGDGTFDEGSIANLFGGVATFAFLSFALGAVLALAAWFGLRSMRGVQGLVLTTVIAIVSSGLAMDIGTRIAKAVRPTFDPNVPGDYRFTVRLWFDSDVSQPWLLLICAPTTAVIVYLICVLTAKNPTLRPDEPAADPGWTPVAAPSHGWPQGGELVGHPQYGVGEGVQTGWAPTGASGPADGAGGDDHPAPRQDP